MFPNPQAALPLPPRPNIEQYKKLAKELVRACKSDAPDAIHAWTQKWITSLFALASPQTPGIFERTAEGVEQFTEFARRKLDAGDGVAKCTLAGAQFVIARSHGFESWPKFTKHIENLARADSKDAQFETAADAIVRGDIEILQRLLKKNPQLIGERSAREHNATLLHYVSANGVEGSRQKTPSNAVQIAELLLNAGAEVDAVANVYGGDSTTLALVATSRPPQRAGLQNALLEVLLDHGASVDSGSYNIVNVCLANGHVGAAQFLFQHGARLDIEGAAGIGRADLVQTFFDGDGKLKSSANMEKLQRGFLWACEFGWNDVVEILLNTGADLYSQGGTRETALHWAVVGGKLSTIKLLLDRGAPLEELNGYGGTALGQALWSFANDSENVDYVPVIEMLLAAGAKIEDGTLEWLEKQKDRAAEKQRIAQILRRYGATT